MGLGNRRDEPVGRGPERSEDRRACRVGSAGWTAEAGRPVMMAEGLSLGPMEVLDSTSDHWAADLVVEFEEA